jgi:Na+/H+-dicarboxylate symporter
MGESMKLWAKILIAIVAGTVTGFLLGPDAAFLKPVGTLFLNMLKMLIVPLMFASMTAGITNMPDTKQLGRVGFVAISLYAVTTLIAIGFGLFVSDWLAFGKELHLAQVQPIPAKALPTFAALFESIVPKNPIQAFADGNILQIIVFSVFFGTALNLTGAKAKPVVDFLESLSAIMLRLTAMIMAFSPIGVFALMAWTAGSFGLDVLFPVLKFLASYWIAAILFASAVFCYILRFMAKLSPLPFFKGMASVIATAASTCSSSASLPLTLQVAQEKLGISKSLANFILPLGCTLNMNGSALFQSMSAIFIAQAYGIELAPQHIITIVTTVFMATLGTASVPGGGLIMLSIVFASIGIPMEGLAILAGIDRLRDMATTPLNITGDAVCAVYVAKRENELDTNVYYQETSVVASKAST